MRRLPLLLLLLPLAAAAQPVALRSVQIRAVQTGIPSPVRLAMDPGDALVWVTFDGRVFRVPFPYNGLQPEVIASPATHGITGLIQGMTMGPDGTLFLVTNLQTDSTNVGLIRRGAPRAEGGFAWRTVARTVPYPRSNTPYDHAFNGIALSPDGQFLFVNSGSRTDHGEVQSNAGRFPGVREVPLTSAILRIPARADSLVLPDDEAALRSGGYLFADGVRNSFDLAFDRDGRLFATENAGDRDDNEELNWIREGHHYGFPWRIGTNDTPMRFPGYDPAQDRLLNPASTSVQRGDFYNDPAYPPPPAGVTFTEPLRNTGPDANLYRDPATGDIRDADGQPFGTFTSHRSPLGLVMNPGRSTMQGYEACVVSWTGPESDLLRPFTDEGEDLLCLNWTAVSDTMRAQVVRVAKGFVNPIDVVYGRRNSLFVLEYGEDATIWEVWFGPIPAVEPGARAAAWQVRLWPEPAPQGQGRLSFTAPVSQAVRVEVVSLLGRRAAVLFDGLAAGNVPQTVPLALDLAPGVYVLRIRGAQEEVTRPFVVR